MIIYDVSRAIVRAYARLWHRIEIIGEEHIPACGIFIASSHGSYLDPPLIGSYAGSHRVSFIAKRELRDWPLIGHWMVACRTLFIRRGGVNRELEEQAIQLAKDGGCVCVFPEGTRTRTGALGAGKAGVGKLFLRTGIPVVPAHIDGNFRAYPPGGWFPRPAKITIRYGRPLTFPVTEQPAKEQCQAAVDEVMAAIRALRPGTGI